MYCMIQVWCVCLLVVVLFVFVVLFVVGFVVSGVVFVQNIGVIVMLVGNGMVVMIVLLQVNFNVGGVFGMVVYGIVGMFMLLFVNVVFGQVVVGGKVFDEVIKVVVLQKLCDIYGVMNVVDQIEVGDVVMLLNWSVNVQKLFGVQFKQISKGQLKINGMQIEMKGEVYNEVQCQQFVSDMVNMLNLMYMIKNGLCVLVFEQGVFDQMFVNWMIEFEIGSVMLMLQGKLIFDQMVVVFVKMQNCMVDIIGYIDNLGNWMLNIVLSQVCVDVVKGYLIMKSILLQQMMMMGVGLDQLIVLNDMVDGWVWNWWIEFCVGQ